MKGILFLPALIFCYLTSNGQQAGTFTDTRDGKTYKVVKIGTQTWMAENLNYNMDGSCCYGNAPANCSKYGRLYTWEAAKKASPKGWHLPSFKEWMTLINYVGGENIAGKKIKSSTGWQKTGNGLNAYGFSALPAGSKNDKGIFGLNGEVSDWWSATEYDLKNAVSFMIGTYYNGIIKNYLSPKMNSYSVRCVKD